MPALVVRDLAEWLAPRGGQVVAGKTPPGLDRAITNVVHLSNLRKREMDELAPYDVVVVAAAVFQADAPYTLEGLIAELAEAQAALVIPGLLPFEGGDPRPYQAADAHSLPLIAVPADAALADLLADIDRLIRQSEVTHDRFLRAMQSHLSRARQTGDSLPAQAQAMADVTQLHFLVEDEWRVRVLLATPADSLCTDETVEAALASHAARQFVRAATPAAHSRDIAVQRHLPGKLARAIVPLVAGSDTIAYLALIGPDAQVRSSHVDLLFRESLPFAFELGRLRKAISDQRLSVADDLEALLHSALPEGDLHRRALGRGLDLALPHRVLVGLAPVGGLAPTTPPEPWLALVRDQQIAVVLNDQAVRDGAFERLADQLRAESGIMALGVGGAGTGVRGLRRSWREAEIAARIRQALPGSGRALPFAELGLLPTLAPLLATGELLAWSMATLEPLAQAEAHAGDALLQTLDAWFADNGNLTAAARRLGLHRNTLIYRLRRIEDALAAPLDDPDRRLALHLALKIWSVNRR